jgi:dual specificity protein kinase YAK1
MVPLPFYELGHALNAPESFDPNNPDVQSQMEGHCLVSVNEIFKDPNGQRFRVIDVLGSGTYGYVFKCQSIDQPSLFCGMKIIKNLRHYKETGLNEVMVHQCMAAAANHPGKGHVMMPIASFEKDDHVCFVMPLLSRSLFEGIAQNVPLLMLLEKVRTIMEQLLQALDFVHRLGIVHSDLKTDNVLFVSEDADKICLIDFGSATAGDRMPGVYIQSRFYRSPEIILGLPYDSRIDIWSAGCVAAELFLDFAIFGCETESDVMHSMVALLGPIPEAVLQSSSRWQRFFDIGPGGFQPKNDPTAVLLTAHCYHQVFEERGVQPLESLVMNHIPAEDRTELAMLRSFADFLKSLLEFDATARVTAARARTHPFIMGQPLPANWTSLKEPRKEALKSPPVPRRPVSMEAIQADFLSLF